MFLKSHHLYTNKKLPHAPTVQIHLLFAFLSSVVSRLMTSCWCAVVFSSKQHFLLQTLFSSLTAALPKSFSSIFNVFIKDVFVNLWSYLVFSSSFFVNMVPIGAGKEGRQRIPTTSRQHLSACRFHPTFLEDKKQSQGALPVSSP